MEKMPPPGWFQKVPRHLQRPEAAAKGLRPTDAEHRRLDVRSPKAAGEVNGAETEAGIAIVYIKDVALCEKDWTHVTGDFPGSVSEPAVFSTALFCNSSEGNRRASGLTLI